MNLLDRHAPFKRKIFRANNAPYTTKKFRKAIMKRYHLYIYVYGFNKNSRTYFIFLTDGKEQRFVIISVLGLNSYRVFHKVLF